jgi:undecaprenyl-diphosphatase
MGRIGAFREMLKSSRQRLPWWSRHLLELGVVLLALGLFLKLTRETFENTKLTEIDLAVSAWMADHRTPVLNGVARDVTALGSVTLVTFFSLGGSAVLLVGGDRRGVLHLVGGVAGGALLMQGLKTFLERPRPAGPRVLDASGFSYPSGHSMLAAILYFTLALVGARHFREPVYRRTLVALAAFTTVLVAVSRVYLGVHYATDVTSGITLGAAWSVLMASLFAYAEERLSQLRKLRADPPG